MNYLPAYWVFIANPVKCVRLHVQMAVAVVPTKGV